MVDDVSPQLSFPSSIVLAFNAELLLQVLLTYVISKCLSSTFTCYKLIAQVIYFDIGIVCNEDDADQLQNTLSRKPVCLKELHNYFQNQKATISQVHTTSISK